MLRAVFVGDIDLNIFHHLLDFFGILSIDAALYGLKSAGTVHRSGIQIEDAEFFRNTLCQCGFTGTGRSVYCNLIIFTHHYILLGVK